MPIPGKEAKRGPNPENKPGLIIAIDMRLFLLLKKGLVLVSVPACSALLR